MIESLVVVYCNIMFHEAEAKIIRYIHVVLVKKHWLIGNHPMLIAPAKNNFQIAKKEV